MVEFLAQGYKSLWWRFELESDRHPVITTQYKSGALPHIALVTNTILLLCICLCDTRHSLEARNAPQMSIKGRTCNQTILVVTKTLQRQPPFMKIKIDNSSKMENRIYFFNLCRFCMVIRFFILATTANAPDFEGFLYQILSIT